MTKFCPYCKYPASGPRSLVTHVRAAHPAALSVRDVADLMNVLTEDLDAGA